VGKIPSRCTQLLNWIIHIGEYTLEKTKEVIKNGQSRDTGNIEHKTLNKNKQNEKDEQHRSPLPRNKKNNTEGLLGCC